MEKVDKLFEELEVLKDRIEQIELELLLLKQGVED